MGLRARPEGPVNSLDKDGGTRLGSGSRQSRDLPVDSKKLVTRQPIKKNNTRSGKKSKMQASLSLSSLQTVLSLSCYVFD